MSRLNYVLGLLPSSRLAQAKRLKAQGLAALLATALPLTFAPTTTAFGAEVGPFDYGDAPANTQSGFDNSYPSARHDISAGGPVLGNVAPDAEPNSSASLLANGDDNNNTPNDEDGILDSSPNVTSFVLSPGERPIRLLSSESSPEAKREEMVVSGGLGSVTLQLTSSQGHLNAFVDFNADGDWDDYAESLSFSDENGNSLGRDLDLAVGTHDLLFDLFVRNEPGQVATAGIFYTRWRVSSQGFLDSSVDASNGEVEDHRFVITPSISVNDLSEQEGSGNSGSQFNVVITTDRISNQDITFRVDVADGTATSGQAGDYLANSGTTVTLPAGSRFATFPISVNSDYDYEEDETLTVTISAATNATIDDSEATVTIQNDDNDQPKLAVKPGKEFSTLEDSSLTLSLNDFVVTDRDDTQHTLIVDGCGGWSNQNLNKNAVTPSYTVSGATVTPAPDFFGDIMLDVCVDDGSSQNEFKDSGYSYHSNNMSDPLTITITVTPVNDAPTLAMITNPASIAEDSAAQTVSLSGITTGAANETDTLTITATSNNTALIPTPTVSYTSAESTGSLSYTPVGNASGTATITVTVNDNQTANFTASRTFVVVVDPVQDRPTIGTGRTLSTLEDTPITLSLSDFNTNDLDGDSLTLLLDSSCIREASATVVNKGRAVENYTVNGLQVTPRLNYFSEAGNAERPALSLIACVRDSANNYSDTLGFNIAVTPVNDPPEISGQRVLKTNNEQAVFLEPLHFSIEDVDDDRFTLKVLAGDNYTVSGTTVTPKTGFVGELTVQVKANDGKADSAPFSATISVAASTKARVKLTTNRTLVEEGGEIVITASLDKAVDSTVDLTLAFSGQASFGSDYSLPSQRKILSTGQATLSIPAGKKTTEIKLTAEPDSEEEGDESIVISTTVSSNAEPAIPVIELTIVGEPEGDGDRIEEAAGVDGNGDSQDDRLQSNVATSDFTYREKGSDEPVVDSFTLAAIDSSKPAITIRNVEIRRIESTVPQQQISDLLEEGVTIPDDLLAFDLLNVGIGGCTTADVILPDVSNLPDYTTYYKFGKAKPTDSVESLYEFDFDSATNTGAKFSKATINGERKTVITLHLCDGKRGDNDGLENGRISDPGFPAVKAVSGGTYGGGAMGGLTLLLLGLLAFMRGQLRRVVALKFLAVLAALGFVSAAQAGHQELDGSTAIGGGVGYLWQDDDRRPDTQHSNGFVGRIHYNWDHYQASFLTLCYQANQSECKSMYGLGVDVIRDDELTQGLDSRLGVGVGLGMTERSNDNRFDLTPYIHGQIGLVKDVSERWAATASVHAIYTMDGRTAASENAYDDVFVMLGAERRFGQSNNSATESAATPSEAPAGQRPASFGSVDFAFAKTELGAIAKIEIAHMAKQAKAFLAANPDAEFTAHGYSDIGSKGEANAIRLATGRAERLKAALQAHGLDAPIATQAHAVTVPNLEVGRLHRKAMLK